MAEVNIIWDWNGTLLDDLKLCLESINSLLNRRNLPLLNQHAYQQVFSFPVKDYYAAIGFDFSREDFSTPAQEFIDLYNSGVKECGLQSAAIDILSFFKKEGARQFILSAMQQDMLISTLKHNNILHFFEGIAGLNDHYATSKIDRGIELINAYRINRNNTWMLGDTIHDFEVSEALNIRCILIANGHQSHHRLTKTGAIVVDDLNSLLKKYPFS
ncbi:MAG: HAD hydrolase-like protein [Mariniphaga sp.]|nr:HAD hydrolase-like protein [Mariniphaga sp.]MDD4225576.1 HAD hydrolase-like protein [Mariniphaga sp.]MDD4425445.1 HAD hydrolase-like protein [Mariniphaga sp.]